MYWLLILTAGVGLWVLGTIKKRSKENPKLGWKVLSIIGMIITLCALAPFFIGLYLGGNDAFLRNRAIAELKVAKQNNDIDLAKQAEKDIRQAMLAIPTEKFLSEDEKINQDAIQTVKTINQLDANAKTN